jgi:hypothetical protein
MRPWNRGHSLKHFIHVKSVLIWIFLLSIFPWSIVSVRIIDIFIALFLFIGNNLIYLLLSHLIVHILPILINFSANNIIFHHGSIFDHIISKFLSVLEIFRVLLNDFVEISLAGTRSFPRACSW